MLRPDLRERYKNDAQFNFFCNTIANTLKALKYDWQDSHDMAEVASYIAWESEYTDKQICGHPKSSIVSSGEGTNYCEDCAAEKANEYK